MNIVLLIPLPYVVVTFVLVLIQTGVCAWLHGRNRDLRKLAWAYQTQLRLIEDAALREVPLEGEAI